MGRGQQAAPAVNDAASRLVTEAARLEDAGRAARRADDFDTARVRFESAIAMLQDGHPAWRARLHTQLSRMLMLSGDQDSSLHEAQIAVRVAPPGASQAIARARLAVTLSQLGRPAEATLAARQAVEAAQAAGDVEAEGIARTSLGYALRSGGRPAQAADEFRAAVPLAAASGDDEAVVARLIDVAASLSLWGDGDGAVSAAREAVGAARRRGVSAGMPAAAYALYLFHLGRWQTAVRAVDDGLAEEPDFLWLRLMRAHLRMGRGELAAARRQLARVERSVSGPRAGGWDGPHETAAEILLWEGKPARALERVQEALAAIPRPEQVDAVRALVALGLRAAADLRERGGRSPAGRWEGIGNHLIDLLRRHGALMRAGTEPAEVGTRLPAIEALADAEFARLHAADGPTQWAEAAGRLEALKDQWQAAYARYRQAQAALRLGGSPAEARGPLGQAYRSAVRLRAARLRELVESLATHWGVPLTPATAPPPKGSAPREPRGLTPREREVLAFLGQGYSNRRIAAALHINEKTVSVHVGNITGKLGVANRLEAASVAIRLSISAAPARIRA